MISVELAVDLRTAGLVWQPVRGDRFVVRQPDMAGDVFVLSDMTVELHDFPTGQVIGFNGTTEWALDSVEQQATVWLPSEEQLRELLRHSFRRLERSSTGYRVVVVERDGEFAVEHPDAAEAYGRALLRLLRGLHDVDDGTGSAVAARG